MHLGRLHHVAVIAPRADVATEPTLYSQLRDKATSWALKQWREVQQAESGMKFHVKRCACPERPLRGA
jgi:hypothetical protein